MVVFVFVFVNGKVLNTKTDQAPKWMRKTTWMNEWMDEEKNKIESTLTHAHQRPHLNLFDILSTEKFLLKKNQSNANYSNAQRTIYGINHRDSGKIWMAALSHSTTNCFHTLQQKKFSARQLEFNLLHSIATINSFSLAILATDKYLVFFEISPKIKRNLSLSDQYLRLKI